MHHFSWSNEVAKIRAYIKGIDFKVLVMWQIKFTYKSKLNLIFSSLDLICSEHNHLNLAASRINSSITKVH